MLIIYALLLQIITLTTQIDKTAVCNDVSRIYDMTTFYGSGSEGYTDYPTLEGY